MTFANVGIDNRKTRSNGSIPILGDSYNFFTTNIEDDRDGRLTPLEQKTYDEEMAKVRPQIAANLNDREKNLLARELEIVKIITPDAVSNDQERLTKIGYYSNSSLPIPEIREAFDRIKAINKRFGKANRYTASAPSVPRYENGLTQLDRDLSILTWDI